MNTETGRRLTLDELAIVSTLLDLAGNADRWRLRLPELRVVGGCACGCPTVAFAPGGDGRDGPDGLELIADAVVAGSGGDAILLFGHDGELIRLEYMWVGGAPPASWPAATVLNDPRAAARVVR
jgi:hypothetical protein